MPPGLRPMSIIAITIPVAIKIGDPPSSAYHAGGRLLRRYFRRFHILRPDQCAGRCGNRGDGVRRLPDGEAGKAGKALTIAAISSFAGGTIGAVLLLGFAPALVPVALLFHSAEYFALMVVGLSAVAPFAGTGKVAEALLMTVLGLMLATVGESALFNASRFTAGIQDLQSGVGFITLAMALFALPGALSSYSIHHAGNRARTPVPASGISASLATKRGGSLRSSRGGLFRDS